MGLRVGAAPQIVILGGASKRRIPRIHVQVPRGPKGGCSELDPGPMAQWVSPKHDKLKNHPYRSLIVLRPSSRAARIMKPPPARSIQAFELPRKRAATQLAPMP